MATKREERADALYRHLLNLSSLKLSGFVEGDPEVRIRAVENFNPDVYINPQIRQDSPIRATHAFQVEMTTDGGDLETFAVAIF